MKNWRAAQAELLTINVLESTFWMNKKITVARMFEHLPHKCISTAAQAELIRAVNMLVKRQLSLSCSPISMKNWRAAQAELPIINVLISHLSMNNEK